MVNENGTGGEHGAMRMEGVQMGMEEEHGTIMKIEGA